MTGVNKSDLDQFKDLGYVVIESLLDSEKDLFPLVDEYSQLVDELAQSWIRDGTIVDYDFGGSFESRLLDLTVGTMGASHQYLDISLPQDKIGLDTPMHLGSEAFKFLRNQNLLDAVEIFVGPEIESNPVQHIRTKLPEAHIPRSKSLNSNQYDIRVAPTYWHQDQGVINEEADRSTILTVWVPMMDVNEDNGCLAVLPRRHLNDLAKHCFTPNSKGIPESLVGEEKVPLPMKRGDVLFMTQLTPHSSLPNLSNGIRWSFDLRYNPTGQPTGRPVFPSFIARSKLNPENELRDYRVWADLWRDARSKIANDQLPKFNRWNPEDPTCA